MTDSARSRTESGTKTKLLLVGASIVGLLALVALGVGRAPAERIDPVRSHGGGESESLVEQVAPASSGRSSNDGASRSTSDAARVLVADDAGATLLPSHLALIDEDGEGAALVEWPARGDFETGLTGRRIIPLILGYAPQPMAPTEVGGIVEVPTPGAEARAVLRRPATLSGRILVGPSLDPSRVSIVPVKSAELEGVIANESFSWMPRSGGRLGEAGDFEIRALPAIPVVLRVRYFGTETLHEEEIELRPGEIRTGVVIDLRGDVASIEGLVVRGEADLEDQVVAQRWKRRGVELGEPVLAPIDASGAFAFTGLDPGVWRLGVTGDERTTWMDATRLTEGETRVVALDLTEYSEWSDVEVVVLDPAGNRSTDVAVGITGGAEWRLGANERVATGDDGVARFRRRIGPRSFAFCDFSPTARLYSDDVVSPGLNSLVLRGYNARVETSLGDGERVSAVALTESTFPWSRNVYTGRDLGDGAFSIRVPDEGEYRVWTDSPGVDALWSGGEVQSVHEVIRGTRGPEVASERLRKWRPLLEDGSGFPLRMIGLTSLASGASGVTGSFLVRRAWDQEVELSLPGGRYTALDLAEQLPVDAETVVIE